MDGDNKGVPHSDLEPGQAISLRHGVQNPPINPGTLPPPQAFAGVTTPRQTDQRQPLADAPAAAQTVAPPAEEAAPASIPRPTEDHFFNKSAEEQSYSPADIGQYDDAYGDDQLIDAAWVSPEFVAHAKSQRWYLTFGSISFVLVILTFVVTRDFVALAAVLICCGLFGYVAARPPRQQRFTISEGGITIGDKTYPFKDFRSFAVEPEGLVTTIDLMPHKRFAPMLNITYMPEHDPYVPDVLAQHLPLSQHKRTAIDELMQLVRF